MRVVMIESVRKRKIISFCLLLVFLLLNSLAFELKSEILGGEYFEMDLRQLGDIEITSAARKPQKTSLTASSVFVLNQEDIKRSGVTTIADALRLVPGVQVAKMDSNKWAISIRGFNNIISNKLLILMDGRSVYSPFFGGAYWDTIDYILEDIEQIEVVRGPGGTLWGSNAVNGVINIITKNAKDSEGLLVSALVGNEERGKLSIRYGGEINPETQYRVYAKGFEKDEAENGADDWRMGRVGFKINSEPSRSDKLTLQSDVYAGEEGEKFISLLNAPPFGTFASKADVFGANVLFRWQKYLDNDSDFSFQTYYDRTERVHFYVTDKRDTVDLDFQHRFQTFFQQEIIWGLGYRYISDKTVAGTTVSLFPSDRSDRIYSGFIQDEISLIDEKLILTVGTKLEHNSYVGFGYQPSARLLWKFFDKHSLWGSVSRAIRSPSRTEQNITLRTALATSTTEVNFLGNPALKEEELLAYEFGYRFLDPEYSFDVSFYYNDYDQLRSLEIGALIPGTPNVVPFTLDNELQGEAYGFDVAAAWQINHDWRLHGSYSFTQLQFHPSTASNDQVEEASEDVTPHHQFTVRSLWQVSDNWQFDSTLRYVDLIKASSVPNVNAVKSYITIDLRIAWQAHESVELSLIGQNLLGKHREFRGSAVNTQATDIEPSLFFKADFRF